MGASGVQVNPDWYRERYFVDLEARDQDWFRRHYLGEWEIYDDTENEEKRNAHRKR